MDSMAGMSNIEVSKYVDRDGVEGEVADVVDQKSHFPYDHQKFNIAGNFPSKS
jgi:hypothetical protein